MTTLIHWLAALALLLCTGGARAIVILEEIRVPVKVADRHGKEVAQEIVVGLFRESSAPRPYPLLILNHGRATTPAGFARVRVAEFDAAARWLTNFGFLVAVPIRVGYGESGGPDVENSGACRSRNYAPVYHAGAVQTLAVLSHLRQRPDAAKDRAVVAGQSFGGTTAITLAGMNPEGVQAAINFAGGGGGSPDKHPRQPCSAAALRMLFASYGKTARMPTLWLYSENDLYWGAELPRKWFDAFRAAGGVGEFEGFPPVSDDGHRLFSRAPQLWQPRVREFLGTVGYKPLY